MDIVFIGTSAFAVPSLERLLDSAHRLLAVVTQPDRPRGRGRQPAPTPVKEAALARQVPVMQPHRASDPVLLDELRSLAPQVIVVAAYGLLLPPILLAIPPSGCINVHASLLPKYRGAAPINWALIHGEQVTGVSIMLMDAKLDTGPILLQCPVAIEPEDDAASLQDRLAERGAEALVRALYGLEAGTLQATPQDHSQASYAPKLHKADSIIRWDQSALALADRVRGLTPRPGAVTAHEDELLRIWRALPISKPGAQTPGRVATIDRDGIEVETGDGYLLLTEVQPANGRRMSAAAYARGHRMRVGSVLGPW